MPLPGPRPRLGVRGWSPGIAELAWPPRTSRGLHALVAVPGSTKGSRWGPEAELHAGSTPDARTSVRTSHLHLLSAVLAPDRQTDREDARRGERGGGTQVTGDIGEGPSPWQILQVTVPCLWSRAGGGTGGEPGGELGGDAARGGRRREGRAASGCVRHAGGQDRWLRRCVFLPLSLHVCEHVPVLMWGRAWGAACEDGRGGLSRRVGERGCVRACVRLCVEREDGGPCGGRCARVAGRAAGPAVSGSAAQGTPGSLSQRPSASALAGGPECEIVGGPEITKCISSF